MYSSSEPLEMHTHPKPGQARAEECDEGCSEEYDEQYDEDYNEDYDEGPIEQGRWWSGRCSVAPSHTDGGHPPMVHIGRGGGGALYLGGGGSPVISNKHDWLRSPTSCVQMGPIRGSNSSVC